LIDKYIAINRILRSISVRSQDGIDAEAVSSDGYAQAAIGQYIIRDVRELRRLLPRELGDLYLQTLTQLAEKGDRDSFQQITSHVLPDIEDRVDSYFESMQPADIGIAVLSLLHPTIVESAYSQFRAGHYRDAVFNSMVAVFDLLRRKSGLDLDGAQLVAEALSLDHPRVRLGDLTSESGKNEQKGFLQILQGAFLGIRNPKAHSLSHDLDQLKAAQYLVFASLLARRVDEALGPSGSP
jgi:uncharacterized protein (TIGR02391 family)